MSDEIKEEVYKCSKCGLCQSVCPIYIASKNEMYLSRGRYIVLNNFYNNEKPLSRTFIKNLDVCLNCNACKRFCPSNIDSAKIFTELKSKLNYKYSFLSFFVIYKMLLNGFRLDRFIYRFFPFKSLFLNTIVDSFYDVKVKRLKAKNTGGQTGKISEYADENASKIDTRLNINNRTTVVYFEGCVNKYINPSDKNAALNILDKLGYNNVKIISQCCGLPFLSDGKKHLFEKNSEKILKSIPADVKYIVCSCDSCYDTLNKIPDLKSKLIRIDELLRINNIKIPVKNDTVYHKPIFREDDCYLPDVDILNTKGSCALTENFILLKHPDITSQLLQNNFYKKENTDNKIIITTCNLSKYGLKTGMYLNKSNAKVYSYSEYINLFE